jgi:hypothetical protein
MATIRITTENGLSFVSLDAVVLSPEDILTLWGIANRVSKKVLQALRTDYEGNVEKLETIKLVHEITATGLRDSKELVDRVLAGKPQAIVPSEELSEERQAHLFRELAKIAVLG